jgi:D-alanyl-D-alanine carboxypeptidase/D-alanyl-D-alanine-endopeptidase (penicillin-binding protein 4)
MSVVRLRSAVAALVAACSLTAAQPAGAADLAATKAALAREFRPAGGGSGAYARDLETGTDLIAVRADRARIPASVEKLFVTSTALLKFGAAGQLNTRAVSDAEIDADGTLAGNVWIVGAGDPELDEADLRRLAAAVREAGVREVEGGVVADDTAFDRRRGGPRTGYAPDSDLGGRLGALVMRRGFQSSPATYVGKRFAAHLKNAGIKLGRAVRVGPAPDGAPDLGSVGSASMATLIHDINVPSDNFMADMLLKSLGSQYGSGGTTTAGAAVVRSTLDDFGLRPRIADGSGLSRANRTTPRQVVRLLERMEGQDTATAWRSSMAVPGSSGTVARRMRGTAASRCHVKTGTINRVSNLVGVCTTPSGRNVGFAWLMQNVNVYTAHRIQDRMAAIVARYDG